PHAVKDALGLPARLGLAFFCGLGFALAFPPFGVAWLALLAPAGLVLLCRGVRPRRGAAIGFVFGLGFFGLLLKWISILGLDAWLALSAIEAAFLAIFGALAAVVTRLRWWPLWASALWVGAEYARAHYPLGGFPWGRAAYAVGDTPLAALASLGGVPTVSFLVVLAGSLLMWALVVRRGRRLRLTAAVAASVIVVAGLVVPLPSMADRTPAGTDVVGIVQGNVPGEGMEFLGRARTVTKNHLAATRELMTKVEAGTHPRPDWVLWPENSTDIDPFEDAETRRTVEEAVEVAGVPVLVGAILSGPGPSHRQTAGVVWDPRSGPGEVYAKRHPVPFGEYIPFRDLLLPYIDRLQMVGRDTYPGSDPGSMTIAGTPIGEVICFEIAYDEIVADVADDGRSRLLVVQSNNATYTGSGQADQQFAITRLRAIEYGKVTLVATPNGISGVIGPDGEITWKSPEAERATTVVEVPKRTTRTLAATLGTLPELLLVIVGLSAAALAVHRSRRRPAT
ncbi:MAG TPA: apolipoprotein N-acyltransferase, partial [Actinopolymorphaceae bacterium]